MNRKRLDHSAGMLKEVGLAALIGGVGDLAVNSSSGRGTLDLWGVFCGGVLMLTRVYLIGLDLKNGSA